VPKGKAALLFNNAALFVVLGSDPNPQALKEVCWEGMPNGWRITLRAVLFEQCQR
jgi:hypothetical protein